MAYKSYHVNPKTGQASICRASYDCPFGSETHASSIEEARKKYENSQVTFTPMNHTPRSNWVVVNERTTHGVYSAYRSSLKSLRGPYVKSTSAERKQAALAEVSKRYKMPISQVKSIVQLELAAVGAPAVQDDPQRKEVVAAREAVNALWTRVEFEDDKPKCTNCNAATNDVRLRADGFDAEIYGKYTPTVKCQACWDLAAEDI